MELVLFSGIQASGKSTFFKDRFVDTHVRINLDMLRTHHREWLSIRACLEGFRVLGYGFHVDLEEAITRNAGRAARKPIPEMALRAASNLWQPPAWAEGLDALFDVWGEGGAFTVREVARA
jgi:chloramphenicol 3-O-phosphotransferase